LLIIHDSHQGPGEWWRPVDVLRWQARKKGLLEVGYHLVVDRDGTTYRTRDVKSVGSHCPGYNHLSVGVCLIGGRDDHGEPEDNFTVSQRCVVGLVAAAFLLEWPKARVVGHNELSGYTDSLCPPVSVKDILSATTLGSATTLSAMIHTEAPQ
jgi:hypothetical protein